MENPKNRMVINVERKELEALIDKAAVSAAEKTIKKLKTSGRIKYQYTNSFRKTEKILYLYPKLPEDNEVKLSVDKALDLIKNDDYYGVIPSLYFDNMSLAELSEIYDCKYQNISKKRNKLVKILASELFPEDVLNELMEL